MYPSAAEPSRDDADLGGPGPCFRRAAANEMAGGRISWWTPRDFLVFVPSPGFFLFQTGCPRFETSLNLLSHPDQQAVSFLAANNGGFVTRFAQNPHPTENRLVTNADPAKFPPSRPSLPFFDVDRTESVPPPGDIRVDPTSPDGRNRPGRSNMPVERFRFGWLPRFHDQTPELAPKPVHSSTSRALSVCSRFIVPPTELPLRPFFCPNAVEFVPMKDECPGARLGRLSEHVSHNERHRNADEQSSTAIATRGLKKTARQPRPRSLVPANVLPGASHGERPDRTAHLGDASARGMVFFFCRCAEGNRQPRDFLERPLFDPGGPSSKNVVRQVIFAVPQFPTNWREKNAIGRTNARPLCSVRATSRPPKSDRGFPINH